MFNLSGLWGGTRSSSTAAPTADSLDAFAPESTPRAPAAARLSGLHAAGGAAALIALIGGGYAVHAYRTSGTAPALSALTIESDPPGALVLLHGMPKGVTPLTLAVPPGEHPVTLEYDRMQRTVRVTAKPEGTVVHHVQFDRSSGPDAAARPPATAAALSPAPAAATSAGPVAGWLSVTSDVPLQILENGRVIGTTAAERIMLPAGTRTLRFVNDALGFTADRTVQVGPGKTADVAIAVPRAPISINAVPWAEVWIDGVRVGETPIGNHMVPLGSREIVLRHPQFGERRQFATVTLKGPARVSVDLRK